jgi:hypothetical protein
MMTSIMTDTNQQLTAYAFFDRVALKKVIRLRSLFGVLLPTSDAASPTPPNPYNPNAAKTASSIKRMAYPRILSRLFATLCSCLGSYRKRKYNFNPDNPSEASRPERKDAPVIRLIPFAVMVIPKAERRMIGRFFNPES